MDKSLHCEWIDLSNCHILVNVIQKRLDKYLSKHIRRIQRIQKLYDNKSYEKFGGEGLEGMRKYSIFVVDKYITI